MAVEAIVDSRVDELNRYSWKSRPRKRWVTGAADQSRAYEGQAELLMEEAKGSRKLPNRARECVGSAALASKDRYLDAGWVKEC